MKQFSFFDGAEPYRITKPVKLIELFAGYGSQALALKYLGVPFVHHRISEWAINSIIAYKDCHFPDDDTDYSAGLSDAQVRDALRGGRISKDYSNPLTDDQIDRYPIAKLRTVYNCGKASNNLFSITQVHGADLDIRDDGYCYIMTYSFPCTDLSNAGRMAGMAKGSGTRSGLLWEVERILNECERKPDVLLMENVPAVIGQKNIHDFGEWVRALDAMGYSSEYKIMNAAQFEIPQNRHRVFMVSVPNQYHYEMPENVGRRYALKDLLQRNVDEKYYISQKGIEYVTSPKRIDSWTKLHDADDDGEAMTVNAKAQQNWTGDFIIDGIPERTRTVIMRDRQIQTETDEATCVMSSMAHGMRQSRRQLDTGVLEEGCIQVGKLRGGT